MNIYACGNTLVKQDCLPLKILPELRKNNKKIKFIEFDPTENLPEEKELIIIDTIINAKKIMLINAIDKFAETKAVSLHDFDLGLNLKLAKKMGKIKKILIIGVPPNINEEKAVKEITRITSNLSSKNAQHSSCMDHKHE